MKRINYRKLDSILEGLGILSLIILIGTTFAFIALTCPPAGVASAWMVVAAMAFVGGFQVFHLVSLLK